MVPNGKLGMEYIYVDVVSLIEYLTKFLINTLQGGCDANGICGMQVCPQVDMQDDMVMPEGNSTGNAAASCESFNVCTDCLAGDLHCAWIDKICAPSCGNKPDSICFQSMSMPNLTNSEICAKASDIALCASKDYCFTCTGTLMSDGATTCSWYKDGKKEYCDVGGCTESGICGDPNESSCQVNMVNIGTEAPGNSGSNPTPPPTSSAVSYHHDMSTFVLLWTLWKL